MAKNKEISSPITIKMSQNEVKQILLTGPAAADYSGESKKERRTRSKKKAGGAEPAIPSSVSPVPPASSAPAPPASSASAPPAPPTPSSVMNRMPASSAPAPAPAPAPSASAPLSTQEGGSKLIRVELKKRSTAKKVHLQPKKVEVKLHGKKQATKKARRVLLGVSGLHKRMARAKKMTRKVKEMPLSQLREHLIQKKLIKPTSKAPESILRQMAADAQIVASKSL
jgi:hypothetical protein